MKGILTDDRGFMLLENGQLAVGDTTADVAQRVLQVYPGDFKEVPQIGLFAAGLINGNRDPFWQGEAKRQLRSQGLEVKNISIAKDGSIDINII